MEIKRSWVFNAGQRRGAHHPSISSTRAWSSSSHTTGDGPGSKVHGHAQLPKLKSVSTVWTAHGQTDEALDGAPIADTCNRVGDSAVLHLPHPLQPQRDPPDPALEAGRPKNLCQYRAYRRAQNSTHAPIVIRGTLNCLGPAPPANHASPLPLNPHCRLFMRCGCNNSPWGYPLRRRHPAGAEPVQWLASSASRQIRVGLTDRRY
jgi:hypothetical protein